MYGFPYGAVHTFLIIAYYLPIITNHQTITNHEP